MMIFSLLIFVDASVTLLGSQSYVQVIANTQLQSLRDIGSINVKTFDTKGILFYGRWYTDGSYNGEYITIEIVNGTVQLATQIGGLQLYNKNCKHCFM